MSSTAGQTPKRAAGRRKGSSIWEPEPAFGVLGPEVAGEDLE